MSQDEASNRDPSTSTLSCSGQMPLSPWATLAAFGFWLCLLLATLPLFARYLIQLWSYRIEHYQFVPVALVAVVALIGFRWDRRASVPRGLIAWGLIAAGLAVLAIGVLAFSPWLGALAFVLVFTAWAWVSHEPDGKRLIGLALPMAMVLRLPLGWDQFLIVKLQRFSTQLASVFLDGTWTPHLVTGNVISLAHRDLFVAEACSGVQSVFTLAFVAALLVSISRHRLWLAPAYFAASILLAILGNALRISIVAIVDVRLGFDATTGWPHELIGYVTLLIAFGLLISFDRLVRALLHPVGFGWIDEPVSENSLAMIWDKRLALIPSDWELPAEDDEPASSEAAYQPPRNLPATEQGGSKPLMIGLNTLVALISLGLATWAGMSLTRNESPERPVELALQNLFVPSSDVLGERLGTLAVKDHEQARDTGQRRLGLAADVWTIGDHRLSGQLVLSQPYFGWHELCFCYENLDWHLVDRGVLTEASPLASTESDFGSPEYAYARFKRASSPSDYQNGYLWFSAIAYDGAVASPPPGMLAPSNLVRRFRGPGTDVQENLMMLQLWVETPERLSPDDAERFRQAFEIARNRLLPDIRASADDESQQDLSLHRAAGPDELTSLAPSPELP
ncbi:MAG: exosortase [Planctomycetaceae bacterium]|nr:MAG: exosortase [Planctomycetaceae bacterium]